MLTHNLTFLWGVLFFFYSAEFMVKPFLWIHIRHFAYFQRMLLMKIWVVSNLAFYFYFFFIFWLGKGGIIVITGNTFRILPVVWRLRSIVQHSTVAEEGGFSKGRRESVYTEQDMVMCCCDSWWGSWMNNAGLWSWQDLKNGNVCWDRLKFGGGVRGTRKNSSSAAK